MFALILIEFLLRLIFGIGLAMFITSSRLVTSGFFRVHLWVLMGLATFAALVAYVPLSTPPVQGESVSAALQGLRDLERLQFGLLVSVAIVSYVGAVIWMYEAAVLGKACLLFVVLASLGALLLRVPNVTEGLGVMGWAGVLDRITSGCVLGTVTTAMLLGHWYLNTPTMQIAPLQRLVVAVGIAVVARMLLSGTCAALESQREGVVNVSWIVFLSLRWLAGLVSVLGMAWMTWLTLKIPNTQSATGILYAGVILAFIGELTGQLMSLRGGWPL